MNAAHIERVMIVLGESNAGKSTFLRSMLASPSLLGKWPTSKVVKSFGVSADRSLKVRLTSPHEAINGGEPLVRTVEKIKNQAIVDYASGYSRLNYALPSWYNDAPKRAPNSPHFIDLITTIKEEFLPERILVIEIDPRQDAQRQRTLTQAEVNKLWSLNIDFIKINGSRFPSIERTIAKHMRSRLEKEAPRRKDASGATIFSPNWRIGADFFDFT